MKSPGRKDLNRAYPNMGEPAVGIHSYDGSANTGSVNIAQANYSITGGLPTQVLKIYADPTQTLSEYPRYVGSKVYELKDHLGNVKVTLSDEKQIIDANSNNTIDNADSFEPVVMSYQDYYPFGQGLPSRKYTASEEYRYGFNGMERNIELSINDYSYEFRDYDTRIAKWKSLDPEAGKIPFESPYDYANNMPVFASDKNGRVCIPCLVLLAGLLTAPEVAVAPTGKPSDSKAINDARRLKGYWIDRSFVAFSSLRAGTLLIEQTSSVGIETMIAGKVLSAQRMYYYYGPTLVAAARLVADVVDDTPASNLVSKSAMPTAFKIGEILGKVTESNGAKNFIYTFKKTTEVLMKEVNIGSAHFKDGTLSLLFNLNRIGKEYKGKGIGSMMMQNIIDNIGLDKLKKIVGSWGDNVSGGLDNLAAFNKALIEFGGDMKKAAESTFTGEMAKRLGFDTPIITEFLEGKSVNGIIQVVEIEVEFVKKQN